ncbi:MAG: hypothetical protein MUO23_11665 [Anaerolineales bacterium]|nr:hypothetical protein [Anaerolineales bacterium]
MSERKPGSKRPSGVTEVKLLITTGTLAVSLLGWAALAVRSEASGSVDPVEASPPAVPPSLAFLMEPLPTVVVPESLAGTIGSPAASPGLRTVDAPPPVQVITITKPSSGGRSSGGGSGRTQSSK